MDIQATHENRPFGASFISPLQAYRATDIELPIWGDIQTPPTDKQSNSRASKRPASDKLEVTVQLVQALFLADKSLSL